MDYHKPCCLYYSLIHLAFKDHLLPGPTLWCREGGVNNMAPALLFWKVASCRVQWLIGTEIRQKPFDFFQKKHLSLCLFLLGLGRTKSQHYAVTDRLSGERRLTNVWGPWAASTRQCPTWVECVYAAASWLGWPLAAQLSEMDFFSVISDWPNSSDGCHNNENILVIFAVRVEPF